MPIDRHLRTSNPSYSCIISIIYESTSHLCQSKSLLNAQSLNPGVRALPAIQRPQVGSQLPIKIFTPNWHLCLVKRIFHHIVRIQFIYPPDYNVHICLRGIRKEQKLRPCQSTETLQAKVFCLEDFDARGRLGP